MWETAKGRTVCKNSRVDSGRRPFGSGTSDKRRTDEEEPNFGTVNVDVPRSRPYVQVEAGP